MPGIGTFFSGNQDRETWPGRLDFLVVLISYVTGLRPFTVFPFYYVTSGSGFFLIPYLLFTVIISIPLIFFETSLGQFSNSGPLKCWKCAPLFQGIGLAMVAASAVMTLLNNMFMSLSLYYLFASFTSDLPWAKCNDEWSSDSCVDNLIHMADEHECIVTHGGFASDSGICYGQDYRKAIGIWNKTGDENVRYIYFRKTASFEYYSRQVLRSYDSEGLDDLGPVVWHLAFCSLLAWIIVAIALCKSVRFYGKVAYVTTILPLCVLLAIFINGMTLDGYKDGYDFYRDPVLEDGDTYIKVYGISDFETWRNAAGEAVFSVMVSMGGLIALGSYSRFRNDTIRDSIIVCVVKTLTSLLAGLTVFLYHGALATHLGTSVTTVLTFGWEIVFCFMPQVFTITSVPVLWSILWFLMALCFSLGAQLGAVETLITAIEDISPKLCRYRPRVVMITCSMLYLLGLPAMTEGGIDFLEWLNVKYFSWSFLLIPIFEILALLVYGIDRFLGDVETMIGHKTLGCIPVKLGTYSIGKVLWFPALGGVIFIMVNQLTQKIDFDFHWPTWADRFGDGITWSTPVFIACGAVVSILWTLVKQRQGWFAVLMPARDWGPASTEHRETVENNLPWERVNEESEPASDTRL